MRDEGGSTISERAMGRDKRSKASELQRLQLVAGPTLETKSKKINTQHDLQWQLPTQEAKLNG